MLRHGAAALAIGLGCFLVFNAAARLSEGTARRGYDYGLLSDHYAREVLGVDKARYRVRFLEIAARISSAVELLLGALLLLGRGGRVVSWGLYAMFAAFSVFLVWAATSGWPVGRCECFAWHGMSLRGHLVLNGIILVALSAVLVWGNATRTQRVRDALVGS